MDNSQDWLEKYYDESIASIEIDDDTFDIEAWQAVSMWGRCSSDEQQS